MNDILPTQKSHAPVLDAQVRDLQTLINDVQKCCQDKQIFECAAVGLPYAEIRCLMLFGNERYLTVKGMADRLEVAKSRITKLINSMNEKGLIARSGDPADGRVRLLRLTARGRKIVDQVRGLQKTMQTRILEKLEPGDRNRVISGHAGGGTPSARAQPS